MPYIANAPRSAGDRLAASALASDFSFPLARANALSLAAGNVALAEFNLKVRSFSVLALAADDLHPTQRELSDFLRLDPSQIVALVDELQRRGLVERRQDPNDRRANVVVATDEGRALHAEAAAAARRAERDAHAGLTPAQRDQFAEILRIIAFSS